MNHLSWLGVDSCRNPLSLLLQGFAAPPFTTIPAWVAGGAEWSNKPDSIHAVGGAFMAHLRRMPWRKLPQSAQDSLVAATM